MERAIPSRAHSSRSAGSRVPGESSPSLIAVPSRSTVSSNAVWEWTGANSASSELEGSWIDRGLGHDATLTARALIAQSRSNPRKRSQSVTAASNALSSTSAPLT